MRLLRSAELVFFVVMASALPSLAVASGMPIITSTFSIVAFDPETEEMGIAVASRVLAVGYIVPWAKALNRYPKIGMPMSPRIACAADP